MQVSVVTKTRQTQIISAGRSLVSRISDSLRTCWVVGVGLKQYSLRREDDDLLIIHVFMVKRHIDLASLHITFEGVVDCL